MRLSSFFLSLFSPCRHRVPQLAREASHGMERRCAARVLPIKKVVSTAAGAAASADILDTGIEELIGHQRLER